MTKAVRDALTAAAVTALDGGLLPAELQPVVRYLALAAQVEITAADLGSVCARAVR
jgi:hypothetical protein